jgi:lysophospholipase L1-like esterase
VRRNRWIVIALALYAALGLAKPALTQQSGEALGAKEFLSRVPANPALPSIFIVGDSTADFSVDRYHEGLAGVQGWGVFFQAFFDLSRVNVVNVARGGRSSRTYQTEGIWQQDLAMIKPNDIVLIQLGQNDVFPVNDNTRARGTLPGVGAETQEIDNLVTHQHEVVHTYGWYIRKYVTDTRSKGATPIVMSLTPRNVWKNGHVEVGVSQYRDWARMIAEQEHVAFVDVSDIIAGQFEKFGQMKVNGLFHDTEPVHMTTPGSFLAAECTLAGLKSLPNSPIRTYLSGLGQFIPSVEVLAGKTLLPAREAPVAQPSSRELAGRSGC